MLLKLNFVATHICPDREPCIEHNKRVEHEIIIEIATDHYDVAVLAATKAMESTFPDATDFTFTEIPNHDSLLN